MHKLSIHLCLHYYMILVSYLQTFWRTLVQSNLAITGRLKSEEFHKNVNVL